MSSGNMRDQLNETARKIQEAKEAASRIPGVDNKKTAEPPRPEFRAPGTGTSGAGTRAVPPGIAKEAPMSGMSKLSQSHESQPSSGTVSGGVMGFYTVKKGDTLSGIAKKYYGMATEPYWKLIQNANQDLIKDPNKIYPDQVFKIPVLPEEMKKK